MAADIVIGTPRELAERFVEDLQREIASRAGKRASIAVPGGSVAERFFPTLATSGIEWKDVDVFWADERAVPPSSPESNYGLADRLWLTPARVPVSRVHRMPADDPDLAAAAASYMEVLRRVAGAPPTLDHLLLGVGDDGHVASVFPDAVADGADTDVTWTDRAPKPPPRRMTLSLPMLARSRRVVIAAFDASKALAIASALENAHPPSPLARLLGAARRPLLLLTPAAAARLVLPA